VGRRWRRSGHECSRYCDCPARRDARDSAESERNNDGGTFNSTSFLDRPQRDDATVTNTYFNTGAVDGSAHGHVKYRNNPDGTSTYLYARDVEGNEYDV